MAQSLLSKLMRRRPHARTAKACGISFHAEPLEVRTLLTADVLAQVVGGNFYLTGVDAGSREITITQDVDNPALLDITPGANTTINGSASVIKIPGSLVTGSASIYLNNGAGTTNTTKLSVNAPQLVLPGSAYIALIGNGADSVEIDGGTILGSIYLSTGGGDDQIGLTNATVKGVASVYSGTGSDAIYLENNTLGTTFATAGGRGYIIDVDSTQGSTYLYAAGGGVVGAAELLVHGNLFMTAPTGKSFVGVYEDTVDGVVVINVGATSLSDIEIQELTAGSTTIVSGGGDTAVSIGDFYITGGLTIVTAGTGNNLVGLFGQSTVTGATTIITSSGNDIVSLGGEPPLNLDPFFDEELGINEDVPTYLNLRSVTILTGTGTDFVALTNLTATTLTQISSGTSLVGVGGSIDVPVINVPVNVLFNNEGGVLAGGPTAFSGPVLIESLGSGNRTRILQTTFGSAFTLYDLKGSNTLAIDDSTFNGLAIFDMGGANNTIDIERNNDLTGYTNFNAVAIFAYFNAASKGAGGKINIGVSGAPTPTAKFSADAYFIGAHLTTWPGAGFSKNPILILSDRVQLP